MVGTRGMIPKIACSTIFQMPLGIMFYVPMPSGHGYENGGSEMSTCHVTCNLKKLTRSDSIEGDTRRRSSSPTLKPSDFLDSDWRDQSGSPFFVFPLVYPSDMGNLVPECLRILWRGQFPVSKAQKPRFDGKKKTMPSCKFSLGPIHWYGDGSLNNLKHINTSDCPSCWRSKDIKPIDSYWFFHLYVYNIYIYVFHFYIFFDMFSPFFGTLRPRAHPALAPGARAGRDGREPEEPVECGIVVLLGDLGHVSSTRRGGWW